MPAKPKTPYVDEKVARLRESSGHSGPWTRHEYRAAGVETIVNPTPTEEANRAAMPANLREAVEAVDVARLDYEAKFDRWQQTVVDLDEFVASARRQTSGWVYEPGDPAATGFTGRKAKKLGALEDAEAEAREARDLAAKRLLKAKAVDQQVRRQLQAERINAAPRKTVS